jgi:hypothetical protein
VRNIASLNNALQTKLFLLKACIVVVESAKS